ncbi:MAG: CYTH and CHAD domain-containing protein [Actinomycetia bacterium]|nr:CYTH and CHAD domain-containing protein [Actinomycetes bacterium]
MSAPKVHHEIEQKLDVPARFRMPDFSGVNGLASVVTQPTVRHTAYYFDTADLRLARSGITLRRRLGGTDAGWHLKLPVESSDSRDDLARDELQLPPDGKTTPPAALTGLVLAVTRGAPIAEVAKIRTARGSLAVLDSDGAPLCEVTDDRVAVLQKGHVSLRFREFEVEAATKRSASEFAEVVAALIAAGATPSTFTSKARRALGAAAAAPADVARPGRVRPSDPAADAVRAHFARNVAGFVSQDIRLRRGLPDAVHQMRVAARRLRSGLRVFDELIDIEWSQQVDAELAWIVHELGIARDVEVLQARLVAGLAETKSERSDKAAAMAVIRAEYGAATNGSLTKLLMTVESPRYLALLDLLVVAANQPRLTEAANEPCATALPPLLRSTWKKLARDASNLQRSGSDEPWHETRLRAKRARYATDALAPVFGKDALRFAKSLEQVTDLLGRHQDAAIAAQAARELALRDGASGQAAFALGMLHTLQREEVADVRREFLKLWPEVSKPRLRRWMQADRD